MSDLPAEVRTKEDAEKVVRVMFREFLDGSSAFSVQLVMPKVCDNCGESELIWKDMQQLPLKDRTEETMIEVREKALRARLNTIDLLVQSTIIHEEIILIEEVK